MISNVDKWGLLNQHPSDRPTVQFDLNRDTDHYTTLKPKANNDLPYYNNPSSQTLQAYKSRKQL